MISLKKYCAILAFAVSAIVFLPEAAFAKGAVVGYVWVLISNFEIFLI